MEEEKYISMIDAGVQALLFAWIDMEIEKETDISLIKEWKWLKDKSKSKE